MSCSSLSWLSRVSRARVFLAAIGVFALLHGAPVLAASSEWALNEGGRMRLILLPEGVDGLRQGALVIEPKPGWITYWKEPGDVGIPPAITPPPGASYSVESVGFPVPKVLMSGEMTDVGYDHPVMLPLTLKNAPNGTGVTLSAFVGVCQNICIPFQADLTVPADTAGIANPVEAALLGSARAKVPPGPSPDFQVTGHELSADHKELVVRLKLPEGADRPKAFVSGPSGHVFVKTVVSEGTNGETVLTLPIGKLPKKYQIAGKHWGILVVSGDRAMESTLAFD
ncbi:MAG: protein-disulfide reductase DsbD family protein [Rhizobium sp.]|nr:protein-disulfide reductase DsbD family protein [Rhizobium sp.]